MFHFVLFWTVLTNSVFSAGYAMTDLANNFTQNGRPLVYDPDSRLSTSGLQKITAAASDFNFTFTLVIVNQAILDDVATSRTYTFNEYSEALAQKAYPGNEVDNVLLGLYSLDDRQYRVRAGSNLMNTYTNARLVAITNTILTDLKKYNWDNAFYNLVTRLHTPEKYGGLTVSAIIKIVLGSISGLVSAIIGCYCCAKSKQEKKLRKIFLTMQEIEKSGKPYKTFVQETCVICLDKLNNPAPDVTLPGVANAGNIISQNISGGITPNAASPPPEMQSKEYKNLNPDEPLIYNQARSDVKIIVKDTPNDVALPIQNNATNQGQEVAVEADNAETNIPAYVPDVPGEMHADLNQGEIKSDGDSVFLPCGHNFHRKCISDHLKVSKVCPICRGQVIEPSYQSFQPLFLSYQGYRYRSYFNTGQIITLWRNPNRTLSSYNTGGNGGGRSAGMNFGGHISAGAGGRW